MSQFANWDDPMKKFGCLNLGEMPIAGSKVCKKDLLEAKRHHSDSDYFPKWKKDEVECADACVCIYPGCPTTSLTLKMTKQIHTHTQTSTVIQ
jgi:hypothetical protein